jgi:ribosome-binding ATPase YchF (GTP1/OBG family)
MELYDMKEFSIDKIIHVGYRILGLITFYTVVGKEMRAWTIPRGTTCAKAAGKVVPCLMHGDSPRGVGRIME